MPAVAQQNVQSVLPLGQELRHVVGLDLEPLGIGGPAGGEDEVADAAAVEKALVKPLRRNGQRSGLHSFRRGKAAAEHRRDGVGRVGGGDEFSVL